MVWPNSLDRFMPLPSINFWNFATRTYLSVRVGLPCRLECRFLFPLWCPLRQFLLIAYSVNWFKATRSHILDSAGNNDTGLFPLATSGSPPSFRIGTISDSFHGEGNTDVKSELFMISVKIGRIACRASFTIAIPETTVMFKLYP